MWLEKRLDREIAGFESEVGVASDGRGCLLETSGEESCPDFLQGCPYTLSRNL